MLARHLLMAVLCVVGAGTWAQAAVQGDAAAGRIQFESCRGCHAIPGYRNAYPSYVVPKLGGQHADYIVSALKAYRDGQRQHPTMQAQAGSLTDQDMRDIAAYLAGAGSKNPHGTDAAR